MIDTEVSSTKQRFGIIGNSPSLNHAIEVAVQVAPTDMTVLITGESGVGKESFSKIIHQLSNHKHGQFIAINCGAIPEGTIDSELFGHEKGSFTGAHEARKGYFEVTNRGTIFLDEIGEMPLGTQARLLRVLEYGEFIRVGSSKIMETDVRVVTASNVDLLEAVYRGKFREDLYYRLSTVPIQVPPLRERGADIELLFRKFAGDFAEKYRVTPIQLSLEAKKIILNYRFPGNIRQLKNLIEQISVLEIDREVNAETILKYLPHPTSNIPALYERPGEKEDSLSERDLLYKVLFDMKKDMTDLKKLVFRMLKGDTQRSGIIEKHQDLFQSLSEEKDQTEISQKSLILDPQEEVSNLKLAPTAETNQHPVQDIAHVTEEEESLSLEKKEMELIIKALRKNNNKRKYAAKDLGISERTLYRKIKQYEIQDL